MGIEKVVTSPLGKQEFLPHEHHQRASRRVTRVFLSHIRSCPVIHLFLSARMERVASGKVGQVSFSICCNAQAPYMSPLVIYMLLCRGLSSNSKEVGPKFLFDSSHFCAHLFFARSQCLGTGQGLLIHVRRMAIACPLNFFQLFFHHWSPGRFSLQKRRRQQFLGMTFPSFACV